MPSTRGRARDARGQGQAVGAVIGEPRVPLSQALAAPDAKRRYNARLFTTIAPRYDLITRLLSYGQDQRWKVRLIRLAAPHPGQQALDIACGTGDLGLQLARAGADVTGLDLVPAMLVLARSRARQTSTPLALVAGDIGELPFASSRFDVVTAGYALRNVPDLDRALRELVRVLRPGGRLLSLDFNRPANAPLRVAYLAYLSVAGSMLGLALHGDPDVYRYIAASLARYPGAPEVATRMQAAGFARARWQPLLGGLMALHVAEVA